MKRLLMVLMLVMLLSGCYEDDTIYYTQEEVDLMIADIEDSFDAQAMNNLNERVLELESELRDFERFEYEDVLDLLDYMESENRFATELDEYISNKLEELDVRRALEYDLILKLLLDDTDIFEYTYENGQIKETNIINGNYEYHTAEEIITQIIEELESD
jgi:hypothetical protein